jgi:hypothetical protein
VTCAASARPSRRTGPAAADTPGIGGPGTAAEQLCGIPDGKRDDSRLAAVRLPRRPRAAPRVGATRPQDTNWARYAGKLATALRQRQEWTHRGAIGRRRSRCTGKRATAATVVASTRPATGLPGRCPGGHGPRPQRPTVRRPGDGALRGVQIARDD